MSKPFSILTYHSIDDSGSVLSTHPDTFEAQMACLAELDYRGTSLAQAVGEFKRSGSWPDKAVAITFDDGYENNLRIAKPILERYGFAATIYVITGHVGGKHDWEIPAEGLGLQPILDWSQVHELVEAGWEIGAHTRTHPNLTNSTAAELASEILGSGEDLERELGRAVETFAYPGGYLSSAATAMVEGKYLAGCTTELRRAHDQAPLPSLPRVDMYYLGDTKLFRRLLQHKLDSYLAFRRFGRRVRSMIRK